ncbi:hypothetical protein DENSPDRAFT_836833 [Dentipellis sp. KUC8613]|nr:hypothetical protein DENSPDRAFT_836833 [Dentipellis sp. KUC8613]
MDKSPTTTDTVSISQDVIPSSANPLINCYIARLPAELIVLTFKLLAPIYHARGHSGSPRLGWIVVTHVCRHWRQIALSNSSLWCKIDERFATEFLEEQLRRSGASPISWWFGTSPNSHKIALLKQHTGHLGRLQISDFDDQPDLDTFVETGLTQPAPLLRDFEIMESPHWRGRALRALPSNLFAGCTPNLRRLCVYGAWLPWLLPDLKALVELEVNALPGNDPTIVPPELTSSPNTSHAVSTCSLIFDALRQMRSLRKLKLQNCLSASFGGSSTHADDMADMPYLEDLILSGEPIACSQVTEFIKIPQACKLTLYCLLDSNASIRDTDFIPPLLCRRASSAKYDFSILFSTTRLNVVVREFSKDDRQIPTHAHHQLGSSRTRCADIQIVCRGRATLPQDWCTFTLISRLCGAFPKGQVDTLSLLWTGGSDFKHYPHWQDTFKLHPGVKHLRLCLSSLIMLITTWSPEIHKEWALLFGQEALTGDVIFPHLQSLSLRFLPRDSKISRFSLNGALLQALVARKNAGLVLQELCFLDCKKEPERLADFKDIIRTVHWEKEDNTKWKFTAAAWQ